MSRTLLSTTVLDGWETLNSSLAPHFIQNINEYEGNIDTPSSVAPSQPLDNPLNKNKVVAHCHVVSMDLPSCKQESSTQLIQVQKLVLFAAAWVH